MKKPETQPLQGFPGVSDGKESACKAADQGSILGSERYPGEGNATLSSTLAWGIPWAEEPGGLQSVGPKELGTSEQLKHSLSL